MAGGARTREAMETVVVGHVRANLNLSLLAVVWVTGYDDKWLNQESGLLF